MYRFGLHSWRRTAHSLLQKEILRVAAAILGLTENHRNRHFYLFLFIGTF